MESTLLMQVKDAVWSYALPGICLFGLLTNSISIAVFMNKKLKSRIYSYFLVHSLADFVYLSICLVYFCLKSSVLPAHVHFSSSTKHFELYAYLYLTTVLALFMNLIELSISVQRLLTVLNCQLGSKPGPFGFKLLLALFFLLAVCAQTPFLFSRDIVPTYAHSDDLRNASFEVIINQFGHGDFFKTCFSALNLFRGALMPSLLLTVNCTMLIAYKRQIRKKLSMIPLTSVPRRVSAINHDACMTRMVFSVGFVFVLSNLPTSISKTFSMFVNKKNHSYIVVRILSNLVLFLAHSTTIFVYYRYDRLFRKKLAWLTSSRKRQRQVVL